MNAESCQIREEERIVWLAPPETMPYVRESVAVRGRRRGPFLMPGLRVVGYADLKRDARSMGNGTIRGTFERRFFFLKDESDPYPGGLNCPSEAVDPLTVRPGVPGEVTDRCTPGRTPAAV